MARSALSRRHSASARPSQPESCAIESLERRDCPAVVGVTGGATISEAEGSTLLSVVLSEPQGRPVQVGYVVSGQGVTGGDYRLSVGSRGLTGGSGTIEFRPGETVKQVRVAAVDDRAREGNETLRFALFRPRGCTVDPGNAAAEIVIADNDSYTAAIVPVGPTAIAEGEGVRFVIELSAPAAQAETFFVSTVEGSATSADFRSLREMPVTLFAGQTRSVPFTLTSVQDGVEETDEYFLVTARPRAADLPPIEPIGVTIRGTGPAPIAVSVADTLVREGNAGTSVATFTIRLGAPALDPVVVQYATQDGTATAGSDYQAASGSLTFARGQISKTVTVNVIGDTVIEDHETFQLVVTATGGDGSATAAGTASIQDDDTAFEIIVTFPDSSLTPAQQQVFRTAARRWSEIIVGDLPDVTVDGRLIDDIEIMATAEAIDGPYGILGQAGPRTFRPGLRGLPSTGRMRFDTADVAMMMSNGTFSNVILHEMGHVIGVGTLWGSFGLLTGAGGANPQYVGPKALAEYQALLGGTTPPTGIPVENVGGTGSRDAHWRESVFDGELMTSIAESGGVAMPISRMTIGSLEDLGYRVNYAAADPYTLPRAGTAGAASAIAYALEQQRARPAIRAAAFARLG